MSTEEKVIPSQKEGAQTGATHKKVPATRHEAILLFNAAKKRLLDVNHWHELCGPASATFQLCDSDGNPISVQPKVGHLIRIKLPAPPNQSGDGYDWVSIEKFIEEKDLMKDEDIYGFRVRPVKNPDGSAAKAHFYTGSATSTFLIMRNTNEVRAMERGRNEKPNVGTAKLLNKVRNAVIAVAAMVGLSTPQWKSLVKGLLEGRT